MGIQNSALPLYVFASSIEFSRLFPSMPVPDGRAALLPQGNAYVAVIGVGLLESAVNLAAILTTQEFSCVVLIGICGAYKNHGLDICDVVRVDSEIVGDVGVQERDGTFLPWSRVGGGSLKVYNAASVETAPANIRDLKSATGVSVNCCTGTDELAEMRNLLFDCDVESMEGASVLAVCKAFGVLGYEVRAVSNFVGERKKSSWKIAEALLALKNTVFDKL